MRFLIVHNIDSGFGSDAIFAFQRSLVKPGDECCMRTIGDGFSPADVVADAESFDRVVISGGDGTVSSLLYQLRGRPVITSVFPSGTANLIFENLGCAPEPSAIARACRAGKTAACDLAEMRWTDVDGSSHKEGFALMSGTGFDAEIMRAAIPNKQAMGEAAYFLAVLSNVKPDIIDFSIDVDGEHHERQGIGCLAANNVMMQGEIEIVPDSRMDDGLLDVIMIESSDAVQLVRPLMAGILDPKGRNVARPHIERFQGTELRVRASQPVPIEVDGDPIDGLTYGYDVRVLPACVNLVVDSISRYADGARPAEAVRPA